MVLHLPKQALYPARFGRGAQVTAQEAVAVVETQIAEPQPSQAGEVYHRAPVTPKAALEGAWAVDPDRAKTLLVLTDKDIAPL